MKTIIGFCLVTVVQCAVLSANPSNSVNDLKGWTKVSIPGVCSYQIPPNMEVQAGVYKAYSESHTKEIYKGLEIVDSKDRVIAQPAGINVGNKQALKSYSRLIVETIHGKAGEFALLGESSHPTKKELHEINEEFRKAIKQEFSLLKAKGWRVGILTWFSATIKDVGGVHAVKISYKRKASQKATSTEKKPPVMVSMYLIPNNDRIHRITASYRLSEKGKWASDLDKLLDTFKFEKR